jgi:DNA-binding MarR family transcriptional regulator
MKKALPHSKEDLSRAISRLVPNVISGAQLSFMSEKSVTHCQFHVLMTLYKLRGVAMNDLARRLGVKMPTATGIVGRLERAGLARRLRDKEDRRKVSVFLTPHGESFIHRFQSSIAERWRHILGFLDTTDLKDYGRILQKLEQGFEKEEKAR